MTSDQKRKYWKKNWNYGMIPEELLRYRRLQFCRLFLKTATEHHAKIYWRQQIAEAKHP